MRIGHAESNGFPQRNRPETSAPCSPGSAEHKGGEHRPGRPSKWSPKLAAELLRYAARYVNADDAARSVAVAPRTMYEWIARGRAGDERFVAFARDFKAARECAHWSAHWRRVARNRAHSRESWQRFWAAREAWWMARLGPAGFSTRRIDRWIARHGRTPGSYALVAELRERGFRS